MLDLTKYKHSEVMVTTNDNTYHFVFWNSDKDILRFSTKTPETLTGLPKRIQWALEHLK